MADQQMVWTGSNTKTPILKFNVAAVNSTETSIDNKYNLTYKMTQCDQKLLRTILNKHGFTEIHVDSSYFTLVWTGSQLLVSILQDFTPNQKINHFPRTTELTRKDKLVHNVHRMQQTTAYAKKKYDFLPQTYLIPGEFEEYERAFRREKGVWIVKPAALSRGRGIYLINHPKQVPVGESVIVSKYIPNPLLLDGYKFDLRLYIAVTSFDPLVIYFYEEGLARFATVKYNSNQRKIKDLCMHLTNYSINRLSDQYTRCEDPEVDNYGNKWSLSALLKTLASLGHDVKQLIARIEDIVIKTIISAEVPIAQACRTFVPHRGNCFELYGFDILVDENLKPWLLEVNMSPSLACDAPLDLKIKSQLLVDLLNLVGIACQDPVEAKKEQQLKMVNNTRYIWRLKHKQNQNQKYRPSSSLNRKLTNEESKLLLSSQEESKRSGGFIRIFPGEETWQLYGQLLEDKSGFNQLLHDQLFGSNCTRPRSSCHTLPQSALRNSKSLNSISDSDQDYLQACVTPAPINKSQSKSEQSISCISLDIDDAVLQKERKEKVISCLNDKNFSVIQSRNAFTAYLTKLKEHFMDYANRPESLPEVQLQISQQLDLILKFIAKTASKMSIKFKGCHLSSKLTFTEKIHHTTDTLNSFIHSYSMETKMRYDLEVLNKYKNGIDQAIFDIFLSSASEEDLEEVLTLSTKLSKSNAAFLGSNSSVNKMMFLPRLSLPYKATKKHFLSPK